MSIPEKMLEVLKHEGVVAIASQAESGPHLVNTWNSYLTVTDDGKLLFPAGRMHQTEANLAKNNGVMMTLGSREVQGFKSKGTGFSIVATAEFKTSGPEYDLMKQRFAWMRAVVVVSPESITQTL